MIVLRYRGYYYDTETGLYYLQSRYYDPVVKRFINADGFASTGQGFLGYNMFAYCNNTPITRADPSGHNSEALLLGWATTMSWLPFVDAFLPIGDVMYCFGFIAIYTIEAVNTVGPDNIVRTATEIPEAINKVAGQLSNCAGNPPPGDPNWGNGFKTFKELKNYLGSPGAGNHWHHIVEQCQIDKTGFSADSIHNTNNIIKVSERVHRDISGYYSSKQYFTDGLTVRDWLAGKSFEYQYRFGLDVLRRYGVL